MRQALFVIAVVGAAFVGGAVVNGPGFRWAQERLLLYMGLQDGGEIASIDLPPAPGEAPIADAPTVEEPTVGKRDPEVQTASATAPASTAAPQRRALDQGVPAPKAEPKATEPFAEAGGDQPEPTADPNADAADPPALLGALAGVLKQTAPAPGAADGPSQEPEPTPELAAPAPLDPSVAPVAESGSKEAAPGGESTDWAELRGKLTAAGVSRYTIEGEPGGRVVFVCLIPMAGKQAVSQRFEAEGDDEFQAARAALRRINLWRAAQAQAEPSK